MVEGVVDFASDPQAMKEDGLPLSTARDPLLDLVPGRYPRIRRTNSTFSADASLSGSSAFCSASWVLNALPSVSAGFSSHRNRSAAKTTQSASTLARLTLPSKFRM